MGNYYPQSFFTFPPWGSGIASGYIVQPYHITGPYYEISGIEQIIGLNPLNGFASLTARISGLENGADGIITGVVVPLGIINGILSGKFANASDSGFLSSIDWNTFNNKQPTLVFNAPLSVLNNIVSGSFASAAQSGFLLSSDWLIFSNKSNISLNSGNLTSSTPGITIVGGTNAVIGAGTTINIQQADANHSGILASGDWTTFNNKQSSLGIPNPTTNSGIVVWSGLVGAGFINTNWIIDGVGMTQPNSGIIKLGYNGIIIPTSSGQGSIGLTENRVSGIFANQINSNQVVVSRFNEVPNGLINSSNKIYTFSFPIYSNSLQLYKNGTYMIPSGIGYTIYDYSISSGVNIIMTTAPTSGATLVGNYTYTS